MSRFETRLFRRFWNGSRRHVMAAAAYRSGTALRWGDAIFDFSQIKHDVVVNEIVAPPSGPNWVANRQLLWTAAEQAETYEDGILAREIVMDLPRKLDPSQWWALVRSFAADEVARHGMVVDLAVHEPARNGKDSAPHAHLLVTTRELGPSGFRHLKNEWADLGLHAHWQEIWGERVSVLLH